jgi:hypothetical protein
MDPVAVFIKKREYYRDGGKKDGAENKAHP